MLQPDEGANLITLSLLRQAEKGNEVKAISLPRSTKVKSHSSTGNASASNYLRRQWLSL